MSRRASHVFRFALTAAQLVACFPDRPVERPAPATPTVAQPPRPLRPAPSATALSPIGQLPTSPCGSSEEGFDAWLESTRRYASALGVRPATVRTGLERVHYDAEVIALDREQRPFKLTFAAFAAKRLTRQRVARGKRVLEERAGLLARIEARFGVPPEILVALWGLESDYGASMGVTPSLQALATLAYDCRRAPRFRDELLHALRILDRGDLEPEELLGAWAGELGQTQFLPSSYEKFGVDFDGDGRVDMVRSASDALASTARYLEAGGWRRGEKYEPDSPNFAALRTWNASDMYCKTVVLFASRLVGP